MTQREAIKRYLMEGNKITAIDALYLFRAMRLAARIGELKQQGMEIEKEMREENGKRFAEYRMVAPQ